MFDMIFFLYVKIKLQKDSFILNMEFYKIMILNTKYSFLNL